MDASDVPELIDQALVLRHDHRAGQRWKDLADIAYISGALDPARKARYIEESVQVGWKSFSDAQVRHNDARLYFESIAKGAANLVIDVEVLSAAVDGEAIRVEKMSGGSGPGFVLYYPERSAGKVLTVSWRVLYIDRGTGAAMATDWVHTATATIPEAAGFTGYCGAWLRGDLDPTVLLNDEDQEAWRQQLEAAKDPD